MGTVNNYRDLQVWQKSMKLAEDVYSLTKPFPSEERFGLTSQLRRAAVSVPSNIAEGYGRGSTGDYVRFLQIALGSVYEIETQLQLVVRVGLCSKIEVKEVLDLSNEIEKMLVVMSGKLRAKIDR